MADQNTLPYVDLKAFKGLFTKSSPDVLNAEQLRIAKNCDYFETYGAVSKIKGSSRVLSQIYTENSVAQPISWIGFYKTSDLDGSVLRHVLMAAGTTIQKIESNGGITKLKSERRKNLFATDDILGRFMFISDQDPDLVGKGNPLIKYDGAKITQWGLTPPGGQETIVDTFYSTHVWTPTNVDLFEESIVTFDGDAMRLDQTVDQGVFYTSFYVQRTFDTPFSPKGDARRIGLTASRVRVNLYIPRGEIDNFRQQRAISSYFGSTTRLNTDYWRFDNNVGNLVEGWNIIPFDFSSGAPNRGAFYGSPLGASEGNFDPVDDLIQTVRFEFFSKNTDTSIQNLRLDKLIKLDEGTLQSNPKGSGGTFNGTYQYKTSFVSKYGHESNVGFASKSVSTSGNTEISLFYIPTSFDPQVLKRRLFRTVAGGTVFLFLDEIDDNESTQFLDQVPDGDLSQLTAPQAGDFSDDNSQPPNAGIVQVWKRTVFLAGDPQNPSTLYFSDDDEPESFPLINTFELDDRITAMYESYSGLVVETETGKWQVIGDNPDFSVDKIIDGMGCVGRRAAGTAREMGWAVDRDGLRLFNLNDTLKISEPIRDKYDDLNKENIELINTVHSKARNMILQLNPDSTGGYTSIFAYQYPVDAIEQGWWSEIEAHPVSNLNFLDIVEIENDNGDFKLYASGDDGMVYDIFNDGQKDWVNASGDSFYIDTQIQTPYLRLGEQGKENLGASGRVRPFLIELRATGDAATWEVTVETAKGSTQAQATSTVVLDLEFGTNNSLLRYPINLEDLISEEYFRITARNRQSGVFSKINAIRIYFKTEPGQFNVTDVDNTV